MTDEFPVTAEKPDSPIHPVLSASVLLLTVSFPKRTGAWSD